MQLRNDLLELARIQPLREHVQVEEIPGVLRPDDGALLRDNMLMQPLLPSPIHLSYLIGPHLGQATPPDADLSMIAVYGTVTMTIQ